LYNRRFIKRRLLAVASIDEHFPAITSAELDAALGDKAVRVEGIQYDVNIEGLEHEEGSPVFQAVL